VNRVRILEIQKNTPTTPPREGQTTGILKGVEGYEERVVDIVGMTSQHTSQPSPLLNQREETYLSLSLEKSQSDSLQLPHRPGGHGGSYLDVGGTVLRRREGPKQNGGEVLRERNPGRLFCQGEGRLKNGYQGGSGPVLESDSILLPRREREHPSGEFIKSPKSDPI